jgi:hypothetical protein
VSRTRWFVVAVVIVLMLSSATAVVGAAGGSSPSARRSFHAPPVKQSRLSQGARMWFTGLQRPRVSAQPRAVVRLAAGPNVDAANPSEDLAAGQSETAIAAASTHVMAAWNDATSFLFPSDSTQLAASATGVGYSANGGRTFTDLAGLPNNRPNEMWSGDPSVVSVGDGVHFLVTSLYFPSTSAFNGGPDFACPRGTVEYEVAVSVATVRSATTVQFLNPIVAAHGGDLCKDLPVHYLLDKPFSSYNATSHTFAISYARFAFGPGVQTLSGGEIRMVRAQHVTPATPVPSFEPPITVRRDEHTVSNQGASPAIADNGDIYVAWERNLFGFASTDPYVYVNIARVPNGASGPDIGTVVTAGQLHSNSAGGVKSLSNVAIAGYSRGQGQDFPSIAYDPIRNRVLVEWNDASHHPLGDVFLRSLDANLGYGPITKVNDDNSYALHFMPAVSIRSDGSIASSWYDRRRAGPTSTVTDYYAELRPSAGVNAADFRVSNVSTDWLGTSSLLGPNFGDYTDNASTGTTTYFTWSDGRLGVPQPFVAAS